MQYFAIIAALLAYTHGFILPPVPQLDGRIVGGVPADITEAPYQVALLFDRYNSGEFFHQCGGVIITPDVVLSTVDCTDRTLYSRWRVRAGSSNYSDGGEVMEIKSSRHHPLYPGGGCQHDLVLLFLTTEFIFGSEIAPAVLPPHGEKVPDGAMATITGWGKLNEESNIRPTQLHKINLPVINEDVCLKAYIDFRYVTGNMICAGNMDGGFGSCGGDQGSAMVIDGVLHGMVSWFISCGRPNRPIVHTRISSYTNWINKELNLTETF